MKKQKETGTKATTLVVTMIPVQANCGNGGGCSVQPYILPYCVKKAA